MSDSSEKSFPVTLAMVKAICAPMPNFRATWEAYRTSDFRRELLRDWAGDDYEKRIEVERLLDDNV